ncbi:auxin efflux carrier [Schizophyllum commune]
MSLHASAMQNSVLTSFIGALQGSVSVLLTIGYGMIAGHFKLIKDSSAKDISRLCVKLLQPALLIINVGSEVHPETLPRYFPIIVWSVAYNLVSIAIGVVARRWFKMPSFVAPACAFNNTTSLPLLLVQSFAVTGLLDAILLPGESASDAVNRAKSYFLINAVIGSSLTFSLGPGLLNPHDEDGPSPPQTPGISAGLNGRLHPPGPPPLAIADDLTERGEASERTALLGYEQSRKGSSGILVRGKEAYASLPSFVKSILSFFTQFMNAPFIGALIGLLLGMVGPLYDQFFDSEGFFSGWLTASVRNIGDLFASLQALTVGVKLLNSYRDMKRGEDAGPMPWGTTVFITFIRFIFWPVVGIPIVYVLAQKTTMLNSDPVLWFCMMLMPVGPPALKLLALADVSGAEEKEKSSLVKFLSASYLISPMICFSVVGALKATQAAMPQA